MAWDHLSITKPHLVYIILGGFTSIFMLVSLFIKEKLYIGEATVATLCGVIFGPHAANLINPLSWGNTDLITLEFSRIVLVTQCFAVGVELPKNYMEKHWRSVLFLLVPVMTFGWLITSLFVWWMIEPLSWLESLVVAACVTATDPVLASSVVGKGKFAKRVPKHLRDVLSAESGCNDGMAFPFIYLALYLVRYDLGAKETVYHWICFTVLYECIFGAIFGVLVGYIGRHMIKLAERKGIIDRESFLVFYFVLALFCAGAGSMLGVDDLLVGFAAGVGFSNDGWFSEKTEESHVSNVIDLLINLTYFVYFGTIIPWDQYNSPSHGLVPWRLVVISIMVIFFRRIPAMLLCKPFIPDIKNWREALFAGHFGPIGVGAIFVAILARAELETDSTEPLSELPAPGSKEYNLIYLVWPVVTFLVISSIIVHGSSVAVFTLGKRINTLTITLSYTTDNEKGPAWMHRLPRISSQSRSMSRASSISEGGDDRLDLPPGSLPGPGGLPRVFLRPQKDEEYEGRTGSRASSLRPSRRRKRKGWDSELGPGGPISASAIHPQPRSDSNAANAESNSDTLLDRYGDALPETLAKSVDTSPDSRSGSVSPTSRHRGAEVEVYEEGGDLIVEDNDGSVLAHIESKDVPKQGKEVDVGRLKQEIEHDVDEYYQDKHSDELKPHVQSENREQKDGSAAAADHADKTITRRFANWKGLVKHKQDETGGPSGHGRPSHQKVRGPAYAYQFGNTIIVEDEDGEVIKSYTLPSVEGERRRTYGPEQLRQGMNRMKPWVGLGKSGVPVTGQGGTDAAKGEASSSSQQPLPAPNVTKPQRLAKPERQDTGNSTISEDDGLRMTISSTEHYGLTGLQKNQVAQSRPLGVGRRMSTRDFLKQMQQMDAKRMQEVDKGDAAGRSTARTQNTQKTVDLSGHTGAGDRSGRVDRVQVKGQSGDDYFSAADRPQAPRAKTRASMEPTQEEDIPTHDVRSSIMRHGKGQTAADARRRRLSTLASSQEQDEEGDDEDEDDEDDEDEQAETAAEKRRRLAALGLGGASKDDDSEESDEEFVQRTRSTEGGGGVGLPASDTAPSPSGSRGTRIRWGGERGREQRNNNQAEDDGVGRKVRGIFRSNRDSTTLD